MNVSRRRACCVLRVQRMRLLKSVTVAAAEIFGTKIGNYKSLKSGNKELNKKLAGTFVRSSFVVGRRWRAAAAAAAARAASAAEFCDGAFVAAHIGARSVARRPVVRQLLLESIEGAVEDVSVC